MSQIVQFAAAPTSLVLSVSRSEAPGRPGSDTAVLADAARAIDTILAQAHEQGALDAVRVLGNLSSLLRALPR